jgi:hypothetical protein
LKPISSTSGVEPTVEVTENEGVEYTYLGWTANDDRGIELHIVGRVAVENPDLVIRVLGETGPS